MAKSWIDTAQATVTKAMGDLGNLALIIVFGGVISIVAGMQSLQSQIAQNVSAF